MAILLCSTFESIGLRKDLGVGTQLHLQTGLFHVMYAQNLNPLNQEFTLIGLKKRQESPISNKFCPRLYLFLAHSQPYQLLLSMRCRRARP